MSNPFESFVQAQMPNAPNAPQQPVAPVAPAQGNPFGQQPIAPVPQQPTANPFGAPQQQQLAQAPVQTVQGFGGQAPGAFGAPQQAAPVVGFGALPDMSQIGESSARDPQIPVGDSILQFKAHYVKTRQGHTAIASFVIEQTNNPQHGPGGACSFVKKLPVSEDKKATAIGFALAMIRGLAGYNDEATFKREVPYWSQLIAAFIYGDPKFAAWAQGKRVAVRGTQGDPVLDKTGKPTGKFYTNCDWYAAPAPRQ